MKFATKLIISLIGIAGTIIGSIVGVRDYLSNVNRAEIIATEKTINKRIDDLRGERNLMISGLDSKITAELSGMKTQIAETNKNVRTLINRSNKEVEFTKKFTNSYTLIPGREYVR